MKAQLYLLSWYEVLVYWVMLHVNMATKLTKKQTQKITANYSAFVTLVFLLPCEWMKPNVTKKQQDTPLA